MRWSVRFLVALILVLVVVHSARQSGAFQRLHHIFEPRNPATTVAQALISRSSRQNTLVIGNREFLRKIEDTCNPTDAMYAQINSGKYSDLANIVVQLDNRSVERAILQASHLTWFPVRDLLERPQAFEYLPTREPLSLQSVFGSFETLIDLIPDLVDQDKHKQKFPRNFFWAPADMRGFGKFLAVARQAKTQVSLISFDHRTANGVSPEQILRRNNAIAEAQQTNMFIGESPKGRVASCSAGPE